MTKYQFIEVLRSKGISYREIGRHLGISKQRVSQIANSIKKKKKK